MSPRRPSGRRFAAFVAALAVCSSAFGAVVLPRLGDSSVPASLKAKPSLIKQKLEEKRCGRERTLELEGDVFERAAGGST